MTNPPPNVFINDKIEHLDAEHDGFYSIVFDPVRELLVELEWANEGQQALDDSRN